MELKFKIKILSDYHIGAGYGRDQVDSMLLKDPDSIPIIRGTVVSGLLRQGIWDLLQLDLLKSHRRCCKSNGDPNLSYCYDKNPDSMCPICRIMGTPANEKRWTISSASVMRSDNLKREKIVWRNRVNPITRTSEEKKLFNQEAVGKGIDFVFTLRNEADTIHTIEEASFIVAGFRMVRNLGSSRRRGKGECRIHLVDSMKVPGILKCESSEDYFLNLFEKRWLKGEELNFPDMNDESDILFEGGSTNRRFKLILRAEEPLIISNRGESGNRFQTNVYIPGYTILGAMAWKVAKSHDPFNSSTYKDFIKLFRRGGIKITPLYPAWIVEGDTDNIYPSIPSPRDLLTCKLYPGFGDLDDGHGYKGYATSIGKPEFCEDCGKKNIKSQLIPSDKFLPIRERPKELNVAKREEMHISIDPVNGMVKKGELFSYSAIESNEYFTGMVEFKDWATFARLIGIESIGDDKYKLELSIGKASKRGYGKAKLWLYPLEDSEDIFIGERRGYDSIKNDTGPITMTLITDTILVDDWGRYLNALDQDSLCDLLGLDNNDIEVINYYVKSKNVDGFNTHLGLPKWRDVSISAGSSVGFKIKSDGKKEKIFDTIEKLENEGVGLRKDEGFGRVAFNHPIYSGNQYVDQMINLQECMRIESPKDNVKYFDIWWGNELDGLDSKYFEKEEWIAVSRWLKINSQEPIEGLENLKGFHTLESPLKELIVQRDPLLDQPSFLDKDEIFKGKNAVEEILGKLSTRLEEQDDEDTKGYLQTRAIEKLADYIASCVGGA
ncbi:MAG: RAMP superfamily CRISPR-associated protein [Thermodesulfobacteriota bacterium]|nr:RAMP superfamily CRISPR-associated protein [Thermodesulfobacteriota bacterium]